MKRRQFLFSVVIAVLISGGLWYYQYDSSLLNVVPDIEGLSPSDILARFGEPDYREIFELTETVLEYRYGLYGFYPNPQDTTVVIMEMFWEQPSRSFAVWFHKPLGDWVVLDNLDWSKDIQF